MRIVVSGTHASGKSTLISDFALRHPEFTVLPDPYDLLLDETEDAPSIAMMSAQLRISAERLLAADHRGPLIAERGPIDFLAYLHAFAGMMRTAPPLEAIERMTALTAAALSTVDLLVVLPLAPETAMAAGSEEHLELRRAMDEALLDLVDDPDVVGENLCVVEIAGDPSERLATLEKHVGASRTR